MGIVGRVTEIELSGGDVLAQYARGRHRLRGVRLDTRHDGVIYLWTSWPSTVDRQEFMGRLAACGIHVVAEECRYRWLPGELDTYRSALSEGGHAS